MEWKAGVVGLLVIFSLPACLRAQTASIRRARSGKGDEAVCRLVLSFALLIGLIAFSRLISPSILYRQFNLSHVFFDAL